MDDWLELIIFAVVIIANIIGGIAKIKQKKNPSARKYAPPPTNRKVFAEQDFSDIQIPSSAAPLHEQISDSYQALQSVPFPETSDYNAPCPACPTDHEDDFCKSQNIQVENLEDDDSENFDYAEFMRTNGKEAFILAEIILPANSRQSYH